MSFTKKPQSSVNPKDTGTVIGSGIVLENVTIRGIGYVRVDGTIIGDIQLEGDLVLGETGRITGEVHATSAQFFGTYEGNIYVDGVLRLAPSCHVDGNIKSGKLIIDEGADFQGTCNMDVISADTHKMGGFVKELGSGDKTLLSGAPHGKEKNKDKDKDRDKEQFILN